MRVTDLDKKKQALSVALRLEGMAMEIPAEDLDSDNGMATLMARLEGVFLK